MLVIDPKILWIYIIKSNHRVLLVWWSLHKYMCL